MSAEPHAAPPGVGAVPIADVRDEVLAWMETALQHRTRYNMVKRITLILENVGVGVTSDLTPAALDRFASKLVGTEKTQQGYLIELKAFCNFAVRKGYLPVSPFAANSGVDARSKVRPARQAPARFQSPVCFKALMTHLEAQARKNVVDHRFYVLVATVSYTGLFPNEVTLLKVSDVDLGAEAVRVPYRSERRRRRSPGVIPIHPDLVKIFADWIETRTRPDPRRQNGDNGSEWLFPSFQSGNAGPWSLATGGQQRSRRMLKAAANAVGMDDLRFPDLRYIYRYQVVPALLTLKPHQAAPAAEVSPVLLGGPNNPPVVLGRPVAVLTPAEFNVVQALLNVYPKGLSWPELDARSGQAFTRTVVKRLKEKDPAWDAVVLNPKDHPQGVCGIVTP